MIISEQVGRLVGFQYDKDGFQFQAAVYPASLNGWSHGVEVETNWIE